MVIAVIGSHPDDQELGMGGTIAKLVSQGHRVVLVDLTDGEPTPRGSRETRQREAAAAAAILGAERVQVGLVNCRLENSIDARRALASILRRVQPEVIFAPHPEDAHPDHVAAAALSAAARFEAKLVKTDLPGSPCHPRWLFRYSSVHLRAIPRPSFLIDTTGFAARKREAILAYASQFVEHEPNRRIPEWIAAADAYFGSRIGTATAEPFSCDEEIGLRDLEGFVR